MTEAECERIVRDYQALPRGPAGRVLWRKRDEFCRARGITIGTLARLVWEYRADQRIADHKAEPKTYEPVRVPGVRLFEDRLEGDKGDR